METPDRKFILKLLETSESIIDFYDELSDWFGENIEKSPLIFYRPRPLKNLSAGRTEEVSATVLKGEVDAPPEDQQLEEFRNRDDGLLNPEHELTHLTGDKRWYGALEYPGAELVFLQEQSNSIQKALKLGSRLNSTFQKAKIGTWNLEVQNLPSKMPEAADYFLKQLTELFESQEAGYYIPKNRNYQLRHQKGFDPDEHPRRRTISRDHVEEVRLNSNSYKEIEDSDDGPVVYIPVSRGRQQVGLFAIFTPDSAEEEPYYLNRQVECLAHLAACLLADLQPEISGKHRQLKDSLTGLKTEDYFRDRVQGEVARGERYQIPSSLLLLDIDNFSKINDTHGQKIGDAVLRKTGEILRESFRRVDIAARFDNDNFGILFANTALKEAEHAVKRLQRLVDEPLLEAEAGNIEINFSGGLSGYPEDGETGEELFKQARLALYQAKKTGKNRIYSTRDL